MSGDNATSKVEESGTRKKTGGRKKGSRNKTTVAVKEAIEAAAAKLGGTERLVEWAKEDPGNERIFWSQIYTKLLPLQVKGDGDNPIPVALVERRIVKADH
jgi:hypothetical protein